MQIPDLKCIDAGDYVILPIFGAVAYWIFSQVRSRVHRDECKRIHSDFVTQHQKVHNGDSHAIQEIREDVRMLVQHFLPEMERRKRQGKTEETGRR